MPVGVRDGPSTIKSVLFMKSVGNDKSRTNIHVVHFLRKLIEMNTNNRLGGINKMCLKL